MIEFRAECGHTVRATDDAAGGVVRCSYCGREVAVPDSETRSLDYLFKDVEQPSEEPKKRRRKRRKRPRRSSSGGGAAPGIDLFAIILRMCYVAFLLIVVIFVGGRYVLPHFRTSEAAPVVEADNEVVAVVEVDHQPPARRRARSGSSTPRLGLMTRKNAVGLYVNATPPSAIAYCIDESRAPETGTIYDAKGSMTVPANGTSLSVSDGIYVVDVMIPWSDPNLNDSALPYFSQYRTFRHKIEDASDAQGRELLKEFFVPDGAADVFVYRTPDQTFLVRRFTHVRVREGRSGGVRALFLPKIAKEKDGGFSIQSLVDHYLPKEDVYGFNRKNAKSELIFFGVPKAGDDLRSVLKALSTIGIAPYMTSDGKIQLFSIGINDGALKRSKIGTLTGTVADDAG